MREADPSAMRLHGGVPTLVLAFLAIPNLALAVQASEPVPCDDVCLGLEPFPWHSYIDGGEVVLDSFAADVEVDGSLAVTRLELVARNTGEFAHDTSIWFPMPAGAAVLGFNLTIGNRTLVGRVEDARQAAQEYTAALAAGEDAVLLEQWDRQTLRLSLSAGPGESRTVRVAYVESLPLAHADRVYRLPLSRLEGSGVQGLSLDVTVNGHGLSDARVDDPFTIDEASSTTITVRHEATNGPLGDLRLRWREPESAWTVSATAAGVGPGADDVALRFTLGLGQQASAAVLPRDVVFVLDRSGSMQGDKIAQATASLAEVLGDLREGDRHEVVVFDDAIEAFHGGLLPSGPALVAADQSRIAGVQDRGATDIDAALRAALATLGPLEANDRLPLVVFLTDGMPTSGVTDPSSILANFMAANARAAAVHVVAIGIDADRSFLEDVAFTTGGRLLVLQPGDDLQSRLGNFYDSVGSPLLSNLEVTVEGADVHGQLPQPIPALYADGTLQVLMRADLSRERPLTVRVTGIGGDGPFEQQFTFQPEDVVVNPAVENLWGAAHVESLLSQERVEGWSEGLEASIVAAAVRFGVVTPYTSWIVVDEAPAEPLDPVDWAAAGGDFAYEPSQDATPTDSGSWAYPTATSQAPSDDADTHALRDADSEDGPSTPGPALPLLAVALLGAVVLLRRR